MNVFRLLRLLASFAIADVWLATVPESAGGWLTAAIQIRRAAWMNASIKVCDNRFAMASAINGCGL